MDVSRIFCSVEIHSNAWKLFSFVSSILWIFPFKRKQWALVQDFPVQYSTTITNSAQNLQNLLASRPFVKMSTTCLVVGT
jgi:hypothetical protein